MIFYIFQAYFASELCQSMFWTSQQSCIYQQQELFVHTGKKSGKETFSYVHYKPAMLGEKHTQI